MQVAVPEFAERLIDQAMTLQGAQSGKAIRHDANAKVPLATGRARVSGMRGAVVQHLQLLGMQGRAQALLDPHKSIGSRGAHEAGAREAMESARAASQAPCAMANTRNAALNPKTLKYTQARSLANSATSR